MRKSGAAMCLAATSLLVGGLCPAVDGVETSSVDAPAAGEPVEVKLPFGPGSVVEQGFWVALDAAAAFGSSVMGGHGQGAVAAELGRRVFLPFQADTLVCVESGKVVGACIYRAHAWVPLSQEMMSAIEIEEAGGDTTLRLPVGLGLDRVRAMQIIFTDANGKFVRAATPHGASSNGEVYLARMFLPGKEGGLVEAGRFGPGASRPRIYQFLPRLFGNPNTNRKINGTLAENGVGKFSSLSDDVLRGLAAHGFTHLWATGIHQQATSTDYSQVGQPADDPDLLKGIAGSPYAIRDYFDVCPDYADDPANRLEEFRAFVARVHSAGLKLIIDFVPNHVARSYASDVRPDMDFGKLDDTSRFFRKDNNFFYLEKDMPGGGPPLRLPTVDHATGQVVNETARLVGGADGLFQPETEIGRVSGNNVANWSPSEGDWFETVKLNYGYNFLQPEDPPAYPCSANPTAEPPDTWLKMDEVIAYWQSMGVDGFRVDMAHMVPPEFWKWLIHRARERNQDTFFMAEAYDNDPAKVLGREPGLLPEDNVMLSLLDAGFDAVYDDPGYDTLEHLYTRGAWANDLADAEASLGPFFFDRAVRYTENHDEVRLASPQSWGGHGYDVGRPATASLFGLSRGPVMLYHGQMVGEPALGREGFGGDDARTSIFDYWSMPEFQKWWNNGAADGGGLDVGQRELRAWYGRLLRALAHPALEDGDFLPLNPVNVANPFFGNIHESGASGQWFLAYLRVNPSTGDAVLVTANFHPTETLRHVRVRLPDEALNRLRINRTGEHAGKDIILHDLLADGPAQQVQGSASIVTEGFYFESIPPMSAQYWTITPVREPPAGAIRMPLDGLTKETGLGPAPLLRLEAGTSTLLDLRRLGMLMPGERFRATAGDAPLDLDLDTANNRLMIRAHDDARGLHLILIGGQGADETISPMTRIPVAIEPRVAHTFRLNGHEQAQSVHVAGSFNGWNTTSHPMRLEDGTWVADVRLPAGRHAYKFVIDGGQWLADPANPGQGEDGNSLVTIGSQDAGNGDPVLLFEEKRDEASYVFRMNHPISKVLAEAIDETGRHPVTSWHVETSGNRVIVRADSTGDLNHYTLLRVIAEDQAGRVARPALVALDGVGGFDSWRDDILYLAFIDRFADGDPSNNAPVDDPDVPAPANYQGGDFDGLRQKIEDGYFERLGVNILWLSPVNDNPPDAWKEYLPPYRKYTGYHGYWPASRHGVEEKFGGEDALKALIASAKSRGMKVLADLVLKHVHQSSPVFREHPELFGRLEDASGQRNLRRWDDAQFSTWFEPFLPAFDFSNPLAQRHLMEDALYWLNSYNLDGFRLDAVKHILPDFWWKFRAAVASTDRGNRQMYFLGETFQSREGIAAFVGPGMLDGQFDFPLYDTMIPVLAQGKGSFADLERALTDSERIFGRLSLMSPLLGNHDKPRFMAYADGDLPDPDEPDEEEVGWKKTIRVDHETSYDLLKLAFTFLLTIDGVPMVYYGDEVGLTGAGDPDNRRVMPWGREVTPAQEAVRAHVATLAHTRRAHPALTLGSRRALLADDSRYAFVRAHGHDQVVVAFNRSSQPADFNLDVSFEAGPSTKTFVDAITGDKAVVQNGLLAFKLPPRSSAVFLAQLKQD